MAALASSPATVVADWWDHHSGGGGWMWLWGTLTMLLGIAAVVLIVWLVVRHASGPTSSRTARDILTERYARGEIDTEEYEERVSKLP